MPRACPVEPHAGSYSVERETPWGKPMASRRIAIVCGSGKREDSMGQAHGI